ncbi:hypothetical protein ElyMa_000234700, partial [Elysia marginata]
CCWHSLHRRKRLKIHHDIIYTTAQLVIHSSKEKKSDESQVFDTIPADLRGYRKAMPRKESNRGQNRGRNMVATSTPELKRIKMAAVNYKSKPSLPPSVRVKKHLVFNDDDSASDIS